MNKLPSIAVDHPVTDAERLVEDLPAGLDFGIAGVFKEHEHR